LSSLGHYDVAVSEGEVGKYLASDSASARDIERMKARAAADGRIAIVLMPADDSAVNSKVWADGRSPTSRGNGPRLIVKFGHMSEADARIQALVNICHALINSAEFIYVD
jgi:hypothetical protein